MEFDDGFYVTKTLPFGMDINFYDDFHKCSEEWQINNIQENSQAVKIGVQENWKIIAVNEIKLNEENFDKLRISIESEITQDITFKTHEVIKYIFFYLLFFSLTFFIF